MREARPWYEDDSFWETWGPLMFTPQRIADSVGEVDKIVSLLKLASGTRILDLGCGIGRITLELARRGFRVTGVDRTRSYLDKAREQADMEKLDIEFIQEDMRSFSRPDSFNSVVSTFTTFGYFEEAEDDKRVVANMCDSLKTGGTFLIDMHGKETLARVFRERDWEPIENGTIVLYERKATQNWSWMWNRWIMLKGNERMEHEFSHRLYAGTEIAALMRSCGFSRADVYGNLEGIPYDHKAQRLIAVGYK